MNKIVAKIGEQRKLKGFSHENMAADLNISPSAYNKIERQDTKLSLGRLLQIQQILDLSTMEMFDLKTENIYNQEVKENGIGNQGIENLYQDNRELTDKFINSLQEEIIFLKNIIKG